LQDWVLLWAMHKGIAGMAVKQKDAGDVQTNSSITGPLQYLVAPCSGDPHECSFCKR
jgi:hypothetical protein